MTPLEAKNLLGLADNCTPKIIDVGNNCYRVNVYQRTQKEDSIMFVNSIVGSYYFRLVDGKYTNETK